METKMLDELAEQVSNKIHESVKDIESLNQWKTHMFTMINKIAELKLSSISVENETNNSLDPHDWPLARNVAHQMLDSSLDHIQFIRDGPVWRPMPANTRAILEQEPLPENGQSLSDMYQDIITYVIPYTKGNTHPRYWGWVSSSGTLGGALADMISSTLSINTCSGTHCATIIERTVIEWTRQLFDFPKETTGGFVSSGTSASTIICIAAARQRILTNVRKDGLVNGPQLVAYGSTEMHGCIVKGLELLGLGSKAMHFVSVDENFRIKIDELKVAIQDDRNKGLVPFCIIGNAGTVNTGAFDNLLELSSIAHTENIWLHVDGAFGSLVILDPQRKYLVSGIEKADSLALDFHKWLHCPYDAGCVLVRDINYLKSTFSLHQSYLAKTGQGCTGDLDPVFDLGPELSRSFRALKVWCTLKEHGTIKLGQKIADNCQQAQYLVSLLEKYDHFIRIIRPVTLHIVNFRVEPKELDNSNEEIIDIFNDELVSDIQLTGIVIPSSTRLNNRIYIRVCITNHRSTLNDVDIFMETFLKLYHYRLQTMTKLPI